MIWGVLYLVALVTVLVVVLRIGDGESRFAIVVLAIASVMTAVALYLSRTRFEIFSLSVVSVDLVLLAIYMAQALRSRRYWPMCLPAFQLINVITHMAKLAAPEIVPRVYSAGQGFWAYPMLAVILGAALWNRADQKARAARGG